MLTLLVVAVGAAGAGLADLGLGLLLGDPRAQPVAALAALPPAVGFDVLLAVFVVPGVAALWGGDGGADALREVRA